jgi:hypothetical protein
MTQRNSWTFPSAIICEAHAANKGSRILRNFATFRGGRRGGVSTTFLAGAQLAKQGQISSRQLL